MEHWNNIRKGNEPMCKSLIANANVFKLNYLTVCFRFDRRFSFFGRTSLPTQFSGQTVRECR